MKKIPIQRLFSVAILTLFIFVGVFLLVFLVILPRLRGLPSGIRANTAVVDFHTHFSLDPAVPQLVLDGRRLRYAPPPFVDERGGIPRVYLRASFLREYIDPFVFWDEGAGVLFISTLYEMLEFTPGSDHFLINGAPHPLEIGIFERDGDIFLPASIVHGLYPIIVEHQPAYNMVVITTANEPQTTATVASARADIRYWPSARAPIAAQIPRGGELTLFVGFGAEEYSLEAADAAYNFVRVRTADGLLGYVLISEIENMQTATPADSLRRNTILDDFIDNNTHHSRVWQGGGGINLVWDYVHNRYSNAVLMQTDFHPSVNVVSPTWFRIAEDGSHLMSFASREYVDWAHSQGVEVWPKIFDYWYTRSRLFLTNRTARQYAINQLIDFVEVFNLDGLNIDFEHLTAAEGPYKIQFLRELAIPMRQRGVVLSAAVKVPIPATAFYQRDLIGKTVDFVMVMTYDEFWPAAPQTGHGHGPNASLPFVRRGVENMLLEVPAERLIMSIPFYNRVWREVVGTGEVYHHRAWGTNTTREFFEDLGVQWVWDFEIGSYFGEVPAFEDGQTLIFRVWLEDARSVQEKMHIFEDNNLAGVAVWMRLFEIDEFWEVIGRYF